MQQRQLKAARFASPGSDLLGLYESCWQQMDQLIANAAPLASQVGVVVAVGDVVVAVETVDTPETWRHVWRKIISGYVSEALDSVDARVREVAPEKAVQFMHDAALAKWQQSPSPAGLGSHATTEQPLTGVVFSAAGSVRHAVLFAN